MAGEYKPISLTTEDRRDILIFLENNPAYEVLGELERVLDLLVIFYPDYSFDYWEMHEIIQAADDYMEDLYAEQEDDEEIDWSTHNIGEEIYF